MVLGSTSLDTIVSFLHLPPPPISFKTDGSGCPVVAWLPLGYADNRRKSQGEQCTHEEETHRDSVPLKAGLKQYI